MINQAVCLDESSGEFKDSQGTIIDANLAPYVIMHDPETDAHYNYKGLFIDPLE